MKINEHVNIQMGEAGHGDVIYCHGCCFHFKHMRTTTKTCKQHEIVLTDCPGLRASRVINVSTVMSVNRWDE